MDPDLDLVSQLDLSDRRLCREQELLRKLAVDIDDRELLELSIEIGLLRSRLQGQTDRIRWELSEQVPASRGAA